MSHRLTTDEYIQRCKDKYGDKYDYSLINYCDNRTKIKIICPKHGAFEKLPSHFTNGSECIHCKQEENVFLPNLNVFLKEANRIHGDKYDYSLVDYKNNYTNIDIICNSCNQSFSQTPYCHIKYSHGCQKCKKFDTKHKIFNKFIKKMEKKYDGVLSFNNTKYQPANDSLDVECIKHGEYKTKKYTLLNGDGGCPECRKEKLKKHYSYDTNTFIELANKKHNNIYDYSETDYNGCYEPITIKCKKHGEFTLSAYMHLHGGGCQKCSIGFSSRETDIDDFLNSNELLYEKNNRIIIKPKELDFYLPNHNLAIEVDGIYWHSELRGKNRDWHLNKTKNCLEQNIKLLHITDYELKFKKRIVESKLKSILNLSKRKIHGRKCKVREIDTPTKSKFLNKYHLQGNDKASVKLGLFYNNRLISIMTFCKRRIALGKKSSEEGEYELSRYCGNFNFYVIGGASKLLKYFERGYNPKKIITYADKRWSTGDLYFKLGFTHTHDSKPNYWYFHKNKYIYYPEFFCHRFNFRKSELHKKLDKFDPNKTEWENMVDNDWDRYWDCGNMVFEKTFL